MATRSFIPSGRAAPVRVAAGHRTGEGEHHPGEDDRVGGVLGGGRGPDRVERDVGDRSRADRGEAGPGEERDAMQLV
jgi:hypothetical protein